MPNTPTTHHSSLNTSFWRIGHRGACGHAPENTLASMRKALDLGVHGFEFDIQLSKDGEPVVIHDATLERTTNGTGNVSDYSLAELQEFDAGNGEKIPSLRDVLDMVDKRCRLFIELKAQGCEAAVVKVLQAYIQQQGWSYEQLYVCAFDHTQLAEISRLDSDIRTSALMVGIPVSLAAVAQEAGAWSLNPNIHHMTQALVDDAHKRGLKVIPWTANQPADIARIKAMGVDGLTSDFPERL